MNRFALLALLAVVPVAAAQAPTGAAGARLVHPDTLRALLPEHVVLATEVRACERVDAEATVGTRSQTVASASCGGVRVSLTAEASPSETVEAAVGAWQGDSVRVGGHEGRLLSVSNAVRPWTWLRVYVPPRAYASVSAPDSAGADLLAVASSIDLDALGALPATVPFILDPETGIGFWTERMRSQAQRATPVLVDVPSEQGLRAMVPPSQDGRITTVALRDDDFDYDRGVATVQAEVCRVRFVRSLSAPEALYSRYRPYRHPDHGATDGAEDCLRVSLTDADSLTVFRDFGNASVAPATVGGEPGWHVLHPFDGEAWVVRFGAGWAMFGTATGDSTSIDVRTLRLDSLRASRHPVAFDPDSGYRGKLWEGALPSRGRLARVQTSCRGAARVETEVPAGWSASVGDELCESLIASRTPLAEDSDYGQPLIDAALSGGVLVVNGRGHPLALLGTPGNHGVQDLARRMIPHRDLVWRRVQPGRPVAFGDSPAASETVLEAATHDGPVRVWMVAWVLPGDQRESRFVAVAARPGQEREARRWLRTAAETARVARVAR